MARPTLAVWKFASCDGCQLSLLDCEDELLAVASTVELASFLEASSRVLPGPWDISLVEGSITTPHDAERIQEVRAKSKVLVAIGACATSGGLQALRNFARHEDLLRAVYPKPALLETLATSTPLEAHVKVDLELRGCPVNKVQLLEVLSALLNGRRPNLQTGAVCLECKAAGAVCVMVAKGEPCLGPVTHAGCGAICPRYARGCYGCFGPSDASQATALARALAAQGFDLARIDRLFATFNAAAGPFEEARRHGDANDPR